MNLKQNEEKSITLKGADTTFTPKNIVSLSDFLIFFHLDNQDIETFDIHHSGDGAMQIDVKLSRKPTQCPVCLQMTTKVKDYSTKKITHSIMTNTKCTINYKARRYVCPRCHKTFYETNPFTVAGSRISLATVYNILEDLRKPNATFTDVGLRYNVSPTTVANLFDSHVSISRRQLPEYLCVDEVYAFQSANSKYVCVLLDFQTHNVIDVLPSRQKRYLMDYLYNIPLKEREHVKVVSFDMWETYRQVSKIMFPNACCAVDHFHVIQEFNRKLTRVRIDTMNRYYSRKNYLKNKGNLSPSEQDELKEASKHYYALKKFNWMFFSTNSEKLDPNCKKKYNSVLERYCNYYDIFEFMTKDNSELDLAYLMKYRLDEFYKKSDINNAKARLEELIKEFRECPVKQMNQFADTLSKWKYEIINSFIRVDGKRITNGIIENRNKSIKLLKHSSNGYLNWSRFRNRIMFCLNPDTTYHMYPISNRKNEIMTSSK